MATNLVVSLEMIQPGSAKKGIVPKTGSLTAVFKVHTAFSFLKPSSLMRNSRDELWWRLVCRERGFISRCEEGYLRARGATVTLITLITSFTWMGQCKVVLKVWLISPHAAPPSLWMDDIRLTWAQLSGPLLPKLPTIFFLVRTKPEWRELWEMCVQTP